MKIIYSLVALILCRQLSGQAVLFSEDFETTGGITLPAGWSQTTTATDGGWKSGFASALSSSGFSVPTHTRLLATNDDLCNCDKLSDFLKSPSVNCGAQNSVFLSLDIYFAGYFSYGSTVETFHLLYSNDGGNSWDTIQAVPGYQVYPNMQPNSVWRTLCFDISAYAGNQSNFKLGFSFSDVNGWAYGVAIDNVEMYCPQQTDIAAIAIDQKYYVSAPMTVSGKMRNWGADTVHSLTINYRVDGGTVISEAISSLNVVPLDTYSFSFSTQWSSANLWVHTLQAWASNINGNTDQEHTNDTAEISVNVCSQTLARKVLYEDFTSATCPPSAGSNSIINPLLFANGVNTAAGKVCAIKYELNYPGAGSVFYTAECMTRNNYYQVPWISFGVLEAGRGYKGATAGMTQPDIDSAFAIASPLSITGLSALVTGNSIAVSGSVNSFVNITGRAKIFAALVENSVGISQGASGTNADTIWYQVMRKMIPNAYGTAIGNLTVGSSFPINLSHVFTNYTGPGTGNPKIFTGLGNTSLVVWVQDSLTKEIYQSETVGVFAAVEEQESALSTLDVYPNPASERTNLKFNLKSNENVRVVLVNNLGQLVFDRQLGDLLPGLHNFYFDSFEFPAGLYSVTINAGSSSHSRKLVIAK